MVQGSHMFDWGSKNANMAWSDGAPMRLVEQQVNN